MNDILRETAAQDYLNTLYAQAEVSRRTAVCRPSGQKMRRLNYVWSLWLGRWGLSVVLHHQG
jgi:hypothetical protein